MPSLIDVQSFFGLGMKEFCSEITQWLGLLEESGCLFSLSLLSHKFHALPAIGGHGEIFHIRPVYFPFMLSLKIYGRN